MRSPPEDVRRWLVAVGLLVGPAASGGPSPGPARRIPQISTAGDAQLRLLRLAFSEDILSGLDAVVALHRRLLAQFFELSPQRFVRSWPCPGQRRRGV